MFSVLKLEASGSPSELVKETLLTFLSLRRSFRQFNRQGTTEFKKILVSRFLLGKGEIEDFNFY